MGTEGRAYGIGATLDSLQSEIQTEANVVIDFIQSHSFSGDPEKLLFQTYTDRIEYDYTSTRVSQVPLADNIVGYTQSAVAVSQARPPTTDLRQKIGRDVLNVMANGIDTVFSNLEILALMLQGQVNTFVYFSTIFLSVGLCVVVMLGLHMVLLARRLLQDAGVFMRSITIALSAAMSVSVKSRKKLSTYYHNLDANFASSLEDVDMVTGGGNIIDTDLSLGRRGKKGSIVLGKQSSGHGEDLLGPTPPQSSGEHSKSGSDAHTPEKDSSSEDSHDRKGAAQRVTWQDIQEKEGIAVSNNTDDDHESADDFRDKRSSISGSELSQDAAAKRILRDRRRRLWAVQCIVTLGVGVYGEKSCWGRDERMTPTALGCIVYLDPASVSSDLYNNLISQ